MMKVNEYIEDYTRHCSNATVYGNENSRGEDTVEYAPWLTPDNAMAAACIAREEAIKEFTSNNSIWKEGVPKRRQKNQYGLPKLYLCQVLTLDMTFGYRYTYRVGFVTDDKKWNLERDSFLVTRYADIICDESMDTLMSDIEKYAKRFNLQTEVK